VTSTSASQTSRAVRTHAGAGLRLGLAPRSTPALHGLHVLVVGIDDDPQSGGIGPYTTGLAQHLSTAAADVTVLTGVPCHPDGRVPAPYRSGRRFTDPGWCLPQGPQVIRLRAGSRAWGPIRRALHDVSVFLHAVAAGRGIAADLVIAVTPSTPAAAAGAFLARRAKVPLITVMQGTDSAPQPVRGRRGARGTRNSTGKAPVTGRRGPRLLARPASRLPGAMQRYALRHSSEVAVASEAFRPAALAAGIPPDRLHLLPNWVRSAAVTESRQSAREALGWPLDRFIVVSAAPLGPRQDLGTAIAAARLLMQRSAAVSGSNRYAIGGDRFGHGLADWDRAVLAGAVDLVVVGEGPQRAAFEQQAFGLSNVRFLTPMDADSQPLVMAAADVLLIAETGAGDGQGTAVLAGYLSAGRPVLAATEDAGPTGCELRRTGGAGLRVSPGDPSALADAILTLQSGVGQRRAMGVAALRYARAQLGQEVSLRRLDLIVESALGAGAATPAGGATTALKESPTESSDGVRVGPSTNDAGNAAHNTSRCRYLNGQGTVDHRSWGNADPTARKGR
jgi:colanic acid biosynthesis glycosyl transferase WcaI